MSQCINVIYIYVYTWDEFSRFFLPSHWPSSRGFLTVNDGERGNRSEWGLYSILVVVYWYHFGILPLLYYILEILEWENSKKTFVSTCWRNCLDGFKMGISPLNMEVYSWENHLWAMASIAILNNQRVYVSDLSNLRLDFSAWSVSQCALTAVSVWANFLRQEQETRRCGNWL
jgi:hypothetical protein